MRLVHLEDGFDGDDARHQPRQSPARAPVLDPMPLAPKLPALTGAQLAALADVAAAGTAWVEPSREPPERIRKPCRPDR